MALDVGILVEEKGSSSVDFKILPISYRSFSGFQITFKFIRFGLLSFRLSALSRKAHISHSERQTKRAHD